MEYTLKHIKCENDLKQYEGFLKNENKSYNLKEYLEKHRGKLAKVELCCDKNQCKTGYIMDIGDSFFVLKTPYECKSVAIPYESLKFITIIHNNIPKRRG